MRHDADGPYRRWCSWRIAGNDRNVMLEQQRVRDTRKVKLQRGRDHVGVSFDVGGIGDKSFNDAAKRGLDQAIDDGLVSKVTSASSRTRRGSNRDENTQSLADDGYQPRRRRGLRVLARA